MEHLSICFNRYWVPDFAVAESDLCLAEDMSRYYAYIKGKKYFSYPEINHLIDFFNSGCPTRGYWLDIPTDKECEQLIAIFGHKDGICHSYHLATALGLGFYGSIGILLTLEDYNENPQDFIYSQAIGYGVTGHYWCHGTGKYKGRPSALCLNSTGEPMICRDFTNDGAHVGYSVRLIARPY